MPRLNGLATRLFSAFLLIILLVALIVSAALVLILRNSPLVDRQDNLRLVEVARGLQISSAPNAGNAQSYLNDLATAHQLRALIVNRSGQALIDSDPEAKHTLRLNFKLALTETAFPDGLRGRARDANKTLWIYVARPLAPNRLLVLAAPQARTPVLAFFMTYLFWPLVQASLLATLLAAALAAGIARSIARPLQQMATVAHGIARGDHSQAAPEAGPDEVRALGQTLNQMSRQVRASQQAERDFLANVSHDLKTPLTSIQGFAQAIVDGAADTPAARERAAGIIQAEAERMRRLVDGLLDLARLDAGLSALKLGPVDPGLLVRAAAERLAPLARERELTLQVELPANLPTVQADGDRLTQVLANLLDNACKHTPAGGRIRLAAEAKTGGLEISVADNGAGIPAEDLGRIFERFYQVDKARTRPGAGLGLAIAREIVTAHGGRMRAESVLGLGSKFTLWLPKQPPKNG